ncbi:hypothetical protein K1719_032145 [Acacia pycnantha]|nr:hypothetical protein K1719_032145 [Acacia pycnantha]
MKIQCNVCEAAEAEVLCCADEAALCRQCDVKVHAANKLATKHQRVPLSTSSSHMPICDICQEAVGYFFCLEDRALLCRKCDVAIHTANSYVSAHQRFLLTGVRVGLEATEPVVPLSSVKPDSGGKVSDSVSTSVSKKGSSMPQPSEYNELLPTQIGGIEEFQSTKVSYGGGFTNWPLDEYFGFNEFNQNLNFMDNANGLSKAESSKFGDSDSSVLRSSEEEMDNEDHLGCVPDSSWTVPQIPSPPTASGLYWPKDPGYSSANNVMFVPDICSPQIHQPLHAQRNSTLSKRRRTQ